MAERRKRKGTPVSGPARPWWMRSLLTAGWLLCLLALGGWGLDYANDPKTLPLKVIRINGEFSHLQPERLQQVVAKAIDGGFFSVDMARVRKAVVTLPWVAEASVRRVWPHTLVMEVREQVPVARWGSKRLVNAAGEVFPPDGVELTTPMPQLSGPPGSATEVVRFYAALQPQLSAAGLQLKRLRLDRRHDWVIDTDTGMTLILGHDDVETRLAQFLVAYPQLVSDPLQRPARVDMRYGHGFAVGWQDVRQLGGKPVEGKTNNSKRGNA